MGPVGRFGMDRRFVYFAILSIVLVAVLVPFAGFVYSSLTGVALGDEPISEMIDVYFLTVLMSVAMALFALPVTLPVGLAAWAASHWFLFDRSSEKWRIRIAAAVSGVAGTAGLAFWLAVLNDQDKWRSIVLVLTPTVLIGALISAEIIYRTAKREI